MLSAIQDMIRAELHAPVPRGVAAAAEAVLRRHGAAVAAILFYGACLRERRESGRVVDFYVVVDRYRAFHAGPATAMLNALLPPNVYYLEVPFEGRTVRAKYAVISRRTLRRGCRASAPTAALWARLSQPCALAYARDSEAEDTVAAALAAAVATLLGEAAPLLPPGTGPREIWLRGFRETYRTEFRAERGNRPELIYEAGADRFDRLAAALPRPRGRSPAGARFRWWLRRRAGRAAHVLRLAKAVFTFDGGLDYVLWKIQQHSGVSVEPSAWQRRHPLLAAPVLAWRVRRRGGFR